MAVSPAALGSFPVIPQLYVPSSRRCTEPPGDVNCFTSVEECHSADDIRDNLRCDDLGGWSVTLVFVGTGAELPWASNCTDGGCKWHIDGTDCGFKSTPGAPMVYAEGLTDAEHILTVTSTEGYNVLSFEYAKIHTTLDTPVHEEDEIWIPASSTQFDFQGHWMNSYDPEKVPSVSEIREVVDGNASVSIDIVADRVHLRHRRWGPARAEAYTYPNWTTSIDGDSGHVSLKGPIDLTPGGLHNISLWPADPEFITEFGDFRLDFEGLSYRPLSNVTRIRDVTPPALIEAAENFDYSDLVGIEDQCKGMEDDDDDDSEGGALGGMVGTMHMGLVSSAVAGYVVWYALCI